MWRKPLDRTLSLARMVNLLSTKVLSDSLVSSNAAFFREWRFSHHVSLLIRLSTACLASSSSALTLYDLLSNKLVYLASFPAPPSLRGGIKRLSRHTGTDFAFIFVKVWGSNPLPSVDNTDALPIELT